MKSKDPEPICVEKRQYPVNLSTRMWLVFLAASGKSSVSAFKLRLLRKPNKLPETDPRQRCNLSAKTPNFTSSPLKESTSYTQTGNAASGTQRIRTVPKIQGHSGSSRVGFVADESVDAKTTQVHLFLSPESHKNACILKFIGGWRCWFWDGPIEMHLPSGSARSVFLISFFRCLISGHKVRSVGREAPRSTCN